MTAPPKLELERAMSNYDTDISEKIRGCYTIVIKKMISYIVGNYESGNLNSVIIKIAACVEIKERYKLQDRKYDLFVAMPGIAINKLSEKLKQGELYKIIQRAAAILKMRGKLYNLSIELPHIEPTYELRREEYQYFNKKMNDEINSFMDYFEEWIMQVRDYSDEILMYGDPKLTRFAATVWDRYLDTTKRYYIWDRNLRIKTWESVWKPL